MTPADQQKARKALGRFSAAVQDVLSRFQPSDRDEIMAMLATAVVGAAIAGAENNEAMMKAIATGMAQAAAQP